MLISKERAEYLAQLSYRYCKEFNVMNQLITYKKAMEFDKSTAEKIISELEYKMAGKDMNSYLLNLNAYSRYFGDELIEVDNYQYVESYEYDYDRMSRPRLITVKMHEGESFKLFNDQSFFSSSDPVYAPNIYGDLFPNKTRDGVAIMHDSREWELYLKLLIIEDRVINPYRLYYDSGKVHTALPMKEKLKWLKDYNDEVTIINKVLDKLNGRLITGYDSSTSILFEIKPTVLYLEYIGDMKLAQEVRKFQNKQLDLNYVIERAKDVAYGLVAISEKTSLVLL